MAVVETPFFLRKAAGILGEEERTRLIETIGMDPEGGEIIPGTGGVRKLRWALPGRGKSGGARGIYYFSKRSMPVFMLSIYAKNQAVNLTPAEGNMLKSLTPELVQSYQKGKTL